MNIVKSTFSISREDKRIYDSYNLTHLYNNI